jgi:parallel beta-helix repeat protein
VDRKTAAILVAGGACLIAAWGPLDPPAGPITGTYKTLTQVEPRIEVNAQNTPGDATNLFKITKPGSYYLTGNITGVPGKTGIYVASSRVTLDLNGFSLEGVNGALEGIRVNADHGIIVRNGACYNWDEGFDVLETNGAQIENLSATGNFRFGIKLGPGGMAANCFARNTQGPNFYIFTNCTVSRCVSRGGGSRGFDVEENSVLNDCTASNAGVGFYLAGPAVLNNCIADESDSFGFHAIESAVLTDCLARDNGSSGFIAEARCRLTRCVARTNLEGFYISEANSLVECTAAGNSDNGVRIISNANTVERGTFHENGGSGIYLFDGVGNSIDGNLATYNDFAGILINHSDNLAVRNRARGNPQGNYGFTTGVDYGVILTNPGAGFASSAAWANFAY